MSIKSVLVIFSDNTLGGTSRSALGMAQVWREAGAEVLIYPRTGLHPRRRQSAAIIGTVVDNLQKVDWGELSAVNLHHGLWGKADNSFFDSIALMALASRPPLITHNVFGEPGPESREWPGPVIVGLLGRWLHYQYRYNSWPKQVSSLVLGNPQDTATFRPPTKSERDTARANLGLKDETVLLRIGSPHPGKWSKSYVSLAQSLPPGFLLLTAGAPAELQAQLTSLDSHRDLGPLESDQMVRSAYWAADRFVLDARQGESFGNVILEALACGLPVIYRERVFADNTPEQFREIPGFETSRNTRAFLRSALDRRASTVTGDAMHAAVSSQYSYAALARQASKIIGGSFVPDHTPNLRLHRLTTIDKLAILASHNPLLMLARKLGRNIRSNSLVRHQMRGLIGRQKP